MKKTITSETAIYGIIGKPVNHSLSPAVHNAVFQLAGIDAVYLPFPVESSSLEAAAAGLRALGISGANVTIPHKEAVIPCLDQLDEAAAGIGAVNTVTVRDGRLLGGNTDWSGFADSLERHQLKVNDCRAPVRGGGGITPEANKERREGQQRNIAFHFTVSSTVRTTASMSSRKDGKSPLSTTPAYRPASPLSKTRLRTFSVSSLTPFSRKGRAISP